MAAQTVLSLVFLALLTFVLLRRMGARRSGNGMHHRLPPSPPGLPVIGHLHLLGSNPHLSLRDIAGRHGAAGDGFMLLRLGQVPALVVSSPRAAEAVLRLHDHAFASRPPSAVADILLSYSDVALAPYGDYWRLVRRLVTTHVLSAGKVQSLRRARQEEVALVVDRLRGAAAASATAVDMTELFSVFTNDMVCRAVSGRFFRRVDGRHGAFQEIINSQVVLIAGFNLDDCFPCLARVGVLARVLFAKAFSLKKKWDVLLDEIIAEHAAKLASVVQEERRDKVDDGDDGPSQEDDDADFVHVLLSLQQEYRLTRQQVKSILVDMFGAGTDTSSILLEYAMIELIRNPHIMAKARDEITKNTPKDQGMVKEEDLANMAYLRAVIKETLRLYPPTPLLLPHFCMEDCEVGGYAIAAGTRVIVNAWALGRDASAWEKADEFAPERFLDGASGADADFRGRDFKFVPFGAGRRMCPGINFGMAVVELMLANLLYCFRWELPPGMTPQDVDMSVRYGLTSRRKEKLLLVPRLAV